MNTTPILKMNKFAKLECAQNGLNTCEFPAVFLQPDKREPVRLVQEPQPVTKIPAMRNIYPFDKLLCINYNSGYNMCAYPPKKLKPGEWGYHPPKEKPKPVKPAPAPQWLIDQQPDVAQKYYGYVPPSSH